MAEIEMTKKVYADLVAETIPGATVKVVDKANGVQKYGVIMPTDDKVQKVVYIDEMYDDNTSVCNAANAVREAAKNGPSIDGDFDWVNDFTKVKPLLRARLYNAKTNAELYKSAEEYGFSDLILVPYIHEIVENGDAKVTQAMLDSWGMTVDEVIQIALDNAKNEVVIKPMAEIMAALTGAPADDVPMYVVNNKSMHFGAVNVILAQERLKEIFPDGYYVIPSSVHEMLVIDVQTMETNPLAKMIAEVNAEVVLPEDVLGDHPYLFK